MINHKGETITSETRILSAREAENYAIDFKERNPNAIRMTYEEFQAEMRKIKK